jgi:hypothetical protein
LRSRRASREPPRRALRWVIASWRAAAMLLWQLGRDREANAIEVQCRETWLRRRIERLSQVQRLVADERAWQAIAELIAAARSRLEKLERKPAR